MYFLDTPQKEDHPQLLAIWEASVRATHHFLLDSDIEYFRNTIRDDQLFDQVKLTVVKDAAHTILGFIGVAEKNLEMLFLHPDAIGKGIGKLLLRHAINVLKITKVDVNEQNETALRFYERFGFKVVLRSPLDSTGRPYPILHLQLGEEMR
jgi:putative acetyltransferase